MRIVRTPKVYLVGRQMLNQEAIDRFLAEHTGDSWTTDAKESSEVLCEVAGRLCYMSFGKGRKSNREYLDNILTSRHGSVLEHAVWNFIVTGVSRSCTHELVRHRAGFAYSQLSQRYVDESETDFIEPDPIAEDPEAHEIWLETVEAALESYKRLAEILQKKYNHVQDRALRRKLARQAARSVLPNATETKIFVSANARSLRHFIEMRANEHADLEIRRVAIAMLRILLEDAPNIFGDYKITKLEDGTEVAETSNIKV